MTTRRITGDPDTKLLECTNPVRDKWRVRWDFQKGDDGTTSFMEAQFQGQPSQDDIKALVTDWYNEQVNTAILSAFSWQNMPVWLSTENQFNYKVAYDLAVQSEGNTLPVTFKFGTDEEPVYHTFSSLDELADFYTAAMKHIQDSLAEGWKAKDAFDVSLYVAD